MVILTVKERGEEFQFGKCAKCLGPGTRTLD